MTIWDQNFSAPGYKYGTEPNAFLREQAFRLPPGSRVLVPGDGEGRNGVWLAAQGHRVTSVDLSLVGLRKAQQLAAEKGVDLAILQADLADWAPEPASFDAVVLTYVHLPPQIRAGAHARLAAGLRAGGCLILEAFHPAQLAHSSGGPKDVAMLYELATLRADLAGSGLEELLAWEGETTLDEGPGHQGLAHVTRYVARRTAS
jgi:SAM-dependent methyltransferase